MKEKLFWFMMTSNQDQLRENEPGKLEWGREIRPCKVNVFKEEFPSLFFPGSNDTRVPTGPWTPGLPRPMASPLTVFQHTCCPHGRQSGPQNCWDCIATFRKKRKENFNVTASPTYSKLNMSWFQVKTLDSSYVAHFKLFSLHRKSLGARLVRWLALIVSLPQSRITWARSLSEGLFRSGCPAVKSLRNSLGYIEWCVKLPL